MHRFLLVATVVAAASTVSIAAQGPLATAAQKAAAKAAIYPGVTQNVLPGTSESAFTTIQGNALSSTNGQLANSIVRLRDARLGRIVGSQVTDKSGLFAFHGVDPGSYVVELVGNDQTVMAASQVLNVNAGEAVSAVVRLPFRIPAFAGLLGHSAPAAATVAAVAAASGVLAADVVTTPTAVPDISPR